MLNIWHDNRLGQSWLIDDDLDMYHEETDTPARARTTTLNEGVSHDGQHRMSWGFEEEGVLCQDSCMRVKNAC